MGIDGENHFMMNFQSDVFGSENQTFVKLDGKISAVLCGPVGSKNGTN